MLVDAGARVYSADLQHLAAGELAAGELHQVQARGSTIAPRDPQQVHGGLAEGIETDQSCHLAPLQVAHQPSPSIGASSSQAARSTKVSISGAGPSNGTGSVGGTNRVRCSRKAAVRMA